jgi:hypothetical protein
MGCKNLWQSSIKRLNNQRKRNTASLRGGRFLRHKTVVFFSIAAPYTRQGAAANSDHPRSRQTCGTRRGRNPGCALGQIPAWPDLTTLYTKIPAAQFCPFSVEFSAFVAPVTPLSGCLREATKGLRLQMDTLQKAVFSPQSAWLKPDLLQKSS